MPAQFQKYARKGHAEARDLAPGEGLAELHAQGITVSEADALAFDQLPPGKVFRNPANPADQWYVARAFFEQNYHTEPLPPDAP